VADAEENSMSYFHALSMTASTGETVDFSAFAGRFCLIVNVASR
jgi:glutathione peroxidase-family protein